MRFRQVSNMAGKAFVAAAVGVSVIASGIHVAAKSPVEADVLTASDAPNDSVEYSSSDGKNVFRGIFFLQGELGKELASLDSYNGNEDDVRANNSDEASAFIDGLIADMEESDPDFFAELSREARSGDPVRFDRSLRQAADLMLEAAPDKIKTLENKDGSSELCVTTAAGAVVVVAAGGVAVVAAVVLESAAVAHAAVYAEVKVWERSAAEPSSGLSEEEAVIEIIEVLHKN